MTDSVTRVPTTPRDRNLTRGNLTNLIEENLSGKREPRPGSPGATVKRMLLAILAGEALDLASIGAEIKAKTIDGPRGADMPADERAKWEADVKNPTRLVLVGLAGSFDATAEQFGEVFSAYAQANSLNVGELFSLFSDLTVETKARRTKIAEQFAKNADAFADMLKMCAIDAREGKTAIGLSFGMLDEAGVEKLDPMSMIMTTMELRAGFGALFAGVEGVRVDLNGPGGIVILIG